MEVAAPVEATGVRLEISNDARGAETSTVPDGLRVRAPRGGTSDGEGEGAHEGSDLLEGRAGGGTPHRTEWRLNIEHFMGKRADVDAVAAGKRGKAGKGLKAYYARQNELISRFEVADERVKARTHVDIGVEGESGAGAGAAGGADGAAADAAAGTVAAAGGADGAESGGEGAATPGSSGASRPTTPARNTKQAALDAAAAASEAKRQRITKIAVQLSMVANIVIFALKITSAVYSGSLAVIGSAIESSLDLLSGAILWVTARLMAKKNALKYPVGKTRMEPLGIIVFAAVMGMAALQLLQQSVETIVKGVNEGPPKIKLDALTYAILGSTIVTKGALGIFCYINREASPSVEALAQDHANDVKSDSVAIITVSLAFNIASLWWADPGAAIFVALVILNTWVRTGRGHIKALSNRAAAPEVISQIAYLAFNHDSRIKAIDTIRAYHVGEPVWVELDIVLPEDMPLSEAHDIGESLQREVEALEEVERAFVHLDTESDHSAADEHAIA